MAMAIHDGVHQGYMNIPLACIITTIGIAGSFQTSSVQLVGYADRLGVTFLNLVFPMSIPPASLSVEQTLDLFHASASRADADTYFGLFANDGVFIGTDASERWTVAEFRRYAMPHFNRGQGWTYRPVRRHVSFYASSPQHVAWFDEILQNERFGETRSSGVLIREENKWKISQFHLTVPIPNHLMDQVVQLIRDDHVRESQMLN